MHDYTHNVTLTGYCNNMFVSNKRFFIYPSCGHIHCSVMNGQYKDRENTPIGLYHISRFVREIHSYVSTKRFPDGVPGITFYEEDRVIAVWCYDTVEQRDQDYNNILARFGERL